MQTISSPGQRFRLLVGADGVERVHGEYASFRRAQGRIAEAVLEAARAGGPVSSVAILQETPGGEWRPCKACDADLIARILEQHGRSGAEMARGPVVHATPAVQRRRSASRTSVPAPIPGPRLVRKPPAAPPRPAASAAQGPEPETRAAQRDAAPEGDSEPECAVSRRSGPVLPAAPASAKSVMCPVVSPQGGATARVASGRALSTVVLPERPASAVVVVATHSGPAAEMHRPTRGLLTGTAIGLVFALMVTWLFQSGGQPGRVLAALAETPGPAVEERLPLDGNGGLAPRGPERRQAENVGRSATDPQRFRADGVGPLDG